MHQYIDRETAAVKTERLCGDRIVNWIYSAPWEEPGWLLKTVASARTSGLLGLLHYDLPFGSALPGPQHLVRALGVDLGECLDPPGQLMTPRALFERKLRYWEIRAMKDDPFSVVSPADARVLVGSFAETSSLFLKGKFFDFEELIGRDKARWRESFRGGDFAIFRLTPEKYHYNHVPAAGTVLDLYQIAGAYHSCNPGAAVMIETPYSKNKRVVTILDTNVPGGTQVGLVAMIEVVALMIGVVEQCYSETGYDDPRPVAPGMFLRKGQPKSRYRPGSSTDLLLFQQGRVEFCDDLVRNMLRTGVSSRYSRGFGRPLVETEVKVRSTIARACRRPVTT
jgi:phosphatidylserine decarboxylase